MNIFLRELKANTKSLAIWIIITLLFIAEGFSEFSAYAGNPELLVILDSMPQAVLESLSLKAFDLTTVSGFYGIMQLYFAVILAIAATMWGSDFISKEERDKTVEFSLTLPIPRSKVITSKALAAFVSCIILNLVTVVATFIAASSYNPDAQFNKFVMLTNVCLFIVQMIFLALGIFLGSAMKYYRRANSTAVSILLGTFFIYIISGLHKDLGFLKYFSPFKYFDALEILHESRIDPLFVGISAVIIVALMAGAYLTYKKRDLYI